MWLEGAVPDGGQRGPGLLAVLGILLCAPVLEVQGTALFETPCGCFACVGPNLQEKGLLGATESST